jgi:hypothetical protein
MTHHFSGLPLFIIMSGLKIQSRRGSIWMFVYVDYNKNKQTIWYVDLALCWQGGLFLLLNKLKGHNL